MVKSDYDLSISNILQSIILLIKEFWYFVALVSIFATERSLYSIKKYIERLNLLDLIMNQIEDFNILQFCL